MHMKHKYLSGESSFWIFFLLISEAEWFLQKRAFVKITVGIAQ